jgi:hypothetical protein
VPVDKHLPLVEVINFLRIGWLTICLHWFCLDSLAPFSTYKATPARYAKSEAKARCAEGSFSDIEHR